MGLDLLHLLSRRRALYRNAGRGQPGQAGRHHARADRPDRRDVRVGARPSGGRLDRDAAVDWVLAETRWSRRELAPLTDDCTLNEESGDAAGQANWACDADHTRSRAPARLLHARRRLEHRCQGEGPRDPATKPGQEAIVLEHGERPAGVRLAFQVAPGSDLGELSARLSKAGIKSERRSGITPG